MTPIVQNSTMTYLLWPLLGLLLVGLGVFIAKKKERYVFKESDFNSFLDTSTARLSKWPINNALKEWKELMKKTYDGYGD